MSPASLALKVCRACKAYPVLPGLQVPPVLRAQLEPQVQQAPRALPVLLAPKGPKALPVPLAPLVPQVLPALQAQQAARVPKAPRVLPDLLAPPAQQGLQVPPEPQVQRVFLVALPPSKWAMSPQVPPARTLK